MKTAGVGLARELSTWIVDVNESAVNVCSIGSWAVFGGPAPFDGVWLRD